MFNSIFTINFKEKKLSFALQLLQLNFRLSEIAQESFLVFNGYDFQTKLSMFFNPFYRKYWNIDFYGFLCGVYHDDVAVGKVCFHDVSAYADDMQGSYHEFHFITIIVYYNLSFQFKDYRNDAIIARIPIKETPVTTG